MANLERVVGWVCFASVFVFNLICGVSSNAEGDALAALKTKFTDPNNVLQSWNSNHHFCTWFNVTCNSENSVTHIDLGNANLSGQLVPQLGQLPNLQYLALFSNNITGRIPEELGNLTNLVSLELYLNSLIGPIPPTLGKLSKLRFLRLNNNSLSGTIPFVLTTVSSLQVLDLSNNQLTGDIPINGSFSVFSPIWFVACVISFLLAHLNGLGKPIYLPINPVKKPYLSFFAKCCFLVCSFANNRLNQPPVSPPPIRTTPSAAPSGSITTGAIAWGVAAGALLLFAGPAFARV